MILKKELKKEAVNLLLLFAAVIVIVYIVIQADKKEHSDSDNKTEVKSEVVIASTEPELHIDTYDDLKNDTAIDSSSIDENDKNKSSGNKQGNDTEKQIKVIDESQETMRDETKGNDKEYDSGTEPNGKVINWHTPSKEGGKEINGDVAAGGKDGVGTWNY